MAICSEGATDNAYPVSRRSGGCAYFVRLYLTEYIARLHAGSTFIGLYN